MPSKSKRAGHSKNRANIKPRTSLNSLWQWVWYKGRLRRVMFLMASVLVLWTGAMYGVAEWYIHKHSHEPLVLGTSFVPDYAKSFGLDPKETFTAILSDLGVKNVRLVSYWKEIEPSPGKYDFSMLDWEFEQANKYGTKVSLAIGLRQPRWPECHEPKWIDIAKPRQQWQPQLFKYISKVVDRYKNNPALADYELENEFFMTVFGECKNFDRQRLVDEFNLVKKLDPNHKIIISRSDNWIGIPVGEPTPDQFAISVYKRVWDSTFTHRYYEYPLPPWFYAMLAGSEELVSGKDMVIHELQAEPWTPNKLTITQISLDEQFKSMNPDRLKARIQYGIDTGMRTINLWGAEWWYWLKQTQDDPRIWDVVKQAVADAEVENAPLRGCQPAGVGTDGNMAYLCN